MTEQTNELYHSFQREERKAEVWRDPNGFYVKLYVHNNGPHHDYWNIVETRKLYNHAEIYAENCAENWVDGIIND